MKQIVRTGIYMYTDRNLQYMQEPTDGPPFLTCHTHTGYKITDLLRGNAELCVTDCKEHLTAIICLIDGLSHILHLQI